jgi:hypothetical protein
MTWEPLVAPPPSMYALSFLTVTGKYTVKGEARLTLAVIALNEPPATRRPNRISVDASQLTFVHCAVLPFPRA